MLPAVPTLLLPNGHKIAEPSVGGPQSAVYLQFLERRSSPLRNT